MKYGELRKQVKVLNQRLIQSGLVLLTWGNGSVYDPKEGVVGIKPSGIDYADLDESKIVVVSLEDGKVVSGDFNPSSDTATHLEIYRAFPHVRSVVHTHSHFAVCFAQTLRSIPTSGTTHADHFRSDIPVTRVMTSEEIRQDYELHTGKVIVETFRNGKISPEDIPGVLVANHGPFTWGTSPEAALDNAIVLEEVAKMVLHMGQLSSELIRPSHELVEKHFLRKHGSEAYYGQKKSLDLH